MTKKVFIDTAPACERRYLDAQRFYNYFIANGQIIVDKPDKADIIILITCGCMNWKSDCSFELIKKYSKFSSKLIVAGCVPLIDEDRLSEIHKGITIVTKDLDKNPEKIDGVFPENKIKFNEIPDANLVFNATKNSFIYTLLELLKKIKNFTVFYDKISSLYLKKIIGKNILIYESSKKTKTALLRISWGCNSNCSYCAIKKSIGPHKSKSIEICIDEFKKGLNNGFKRFIIEADNPGLYGIDTGSSLPELLDEITKIPGDYQILINNISPVYLLKYEKDLGMILGRKKIILILTPIQSGSERILKLMQRYSNIEISKKNLMWIKKTFPHLALFTHVIIGFPTETLQDFYQSLNFIKDIKFDSVFFYAFSQKKGTKSDSLEPKVAAEEIYKRLEYAKIYLKKEGYYQIPENRRIYGKTNKDVLILVRKYPG